MIDPYTDPTTGVLFNRLDIRDPASLMKVEAAISRVVTARLVLEAISGHYDLHHLQAFHRRIFDRIYPWAGEIRTVAIAKADLFCLPHYIASYANEVFGQLAEEKHLSGLSRPAFVDRLTYFYAEVNAIHPFREGNGRAQRAFFHQLAREAGWPLDWSTLDTEANRIASIASLRGDTQPLHIVLDALIGRH